MSRLGNNPHACFVNVGMRIKSIILVLGCAFALLAAEKRTPNTEPRLFLLKSKGATVAELKVLGGATVEVKSENSQVEHDPKSGQVIWKGGATIVIKQNGESPITLKANDEIELVSNTK